MDNNKMCRKKKVFLTIRQKTKILQEFESGCAITDLCKKYNIDQSVIYKWKRKQGILQMNVKQHADSRILRKNPNRPVNDAVFTWFREIKKTDILPSGPAIKNKALIYNEQIGGNSEFVASTGWLDWWKKSYNINQLRSDLDIATKRTSEIIETIKNKGLCSKQIFSADDVALYYKLLPHKVQQHGKNKEDRIMVMPCCNADGSLKIPVLVLGKPVNAKGTDSHPMAIYVNERNASLKQYIFQEWFEFEFVPRVTKFLAQQGLPLQAVLIVDQAHPYVIDQSFILEDVKVIQLPPVMPRTHPLQQGLIENLKRLYRIHFLEAFINAVQDGHDDNQFLDSMTIEKVISWLSEAWINVSSESIANSWLPFLSSTFTIEKIETEDKDNELIEKLIQINSGMKVNAAALKQWVDGDQLIFSNTELDDIIVKTAKDNNNERIIKTEPIENEIFVKREEIDDGSNLDIYDIDPLGIEEETSTEEILNAFDKVIQYCQKKQIADVNEMNTLLYLRQKI